MTGRRRRRGKEEIAWDGCVGVCVHTAREFFVLIGCISSVRCIMIRLLMYELKIYYEQLYRRTMYSQMETCNRWFLV